LPDAFIDRGEIVEEKTKELRQEEKNTLLTFLKLTKEGKYAEIDESSFPYRRIEIRREEFYDEDVYYYSTR
jgi:hypothetical protein